MIDNFDDLIRHVQAKTHENHVLLSFSGGKDAWGTWLAIRDRFEIHPFYYYIVPDLEFVDEYLAHCEKVLGKRILQYPHPVTNDMLNGCTFQPPNRVWALQHLDPILYDNDPIHRCTESDSGLPEFSCYAALGLRAADSIMRSSYFKKYGPVDDKRKVFSPIWNWNKERLITELKRHGIKLSKEYVWFGRSLGCPILLYTWGLKQHAPKDYQRLLDWFPMLEAEVWRYERYLKNGGSPYVAQ